MKAHPTNLHSRRGFTLLEILIATAVAAVVLVAIQSVFYGALRLRNTTTDHIEDDLVLQRTLGLVRHDLAGLMLPGGTLSGSLQTVPTSTLQQDTAGERISPDFYTNSGKVDGWNPYSEVQMVTYYLAAATDGSNSKTLIRSVTRNLLPAQDATPDDQLLLSGALQTVPTSTLAQDTAGERISPDFYTNSGKVDGWNPYSEVQMVTYYLAAATDGSNSKTLVRSVTRNLLPAQDATPDDQLLLPGITSADFLFYDGTGWTDTWDSTVTSTLPTAVKFRVQLVSQSTNASPIELVVPVFVTTTTSAAAATSSSSTATGGTP